MRDKHIREMLLTRIRIASAKGKVKLDLIKHYKRLKRELNRYDNYKRQSAIH